jgi:hypothetical protein
VRLTWSNYGGEGSLVNIEVPADSVILLDGKLAERADAMKPGYQVKMLIDCSYFEFYSTTGQRVVAGPPADRRLERDRAPQGGRETEGRARREEEERVTTITAAR